MRRVILSNPAPFSAAAEPLAIRMLAERFEGARNSCILIESRAHVCLFGYIIITIIIRTSRKLSARAYLTAACFWRALFRVPLQVRNPNLGIQTSESKLRMPFWAIPEVQKRQPAKSSPPPRWQPSLEKCRHLWLRLAGQINNRQEHTHKSLALSREGRLRSSDESKRLIHFFERSPPRKPLH